MPSGKLAVRLADRLSAHHVAGVFSDLFEPAPNAVTVFEDGTGWLVEAYYEDALPDAKAAGEMLAAILEIPQPECRAEMVPDENWVARSQAALPPVYAGRFTIFGSHDRARFGRSLNAIQIDAGEAFGTAHHATTCGCLLAIDRITRRRSFRSALDLGTGSGVLALALQRASPGTRIIGTDLDERSVEVARENAAVNALTGPRDGRLRFLHAGGISHKIARDAAPFDLVVANILAGPLIRLAPDLALVTRCGSVVVLSGILDRQAAEVRARYGSLGFATIGHQRYEEWSTITLVKRT